MGERALQHNAVDAKQLKFARQHNRRRELRERDDMRAALQHAPTRRLLLRILHEARCDVAHVFEAHPELTASVWSRDAAIHANAGRRDLGLLIQGWITAADPAALLQMLGESYAQTQAEHAEIDAAHVATATHEGE